MFDRDDFPDPDNDAALDRLAELAAMNAPRGAMISALGAVRGGDTSRNVAYLTVLDWPRTDDMMLTRLITTAGSDVATDVLNAIVDHPAANSELLAEIAFNCSHRSQARRTCQRRFGALADVAFDVAGRSAYQDPMSVPSLSVALDVLDGAPASTIDAFNALAADGHIYPHEAAEVACAVDSAG